jgi:hypothetical protein
MPSLFGKPGIVLRSGMGVADQQDRHSASLSGRQGAADHRHRGPGPAGNGPAEVWVAGPAEPPVTGRQEL